MVNMLFNKVIGENEKHVFYFYFKTEQIFGQLFLLTGIKMKF